MNERFVDFMYVLMRDHTVCGIVEEIVANHLESSPLLDGQGNDPSTFSNKGLENYSREIVKRVEKVSKT